MGQQVSRPYIAYNDSGSVSPRCPVTGQSSREEKKDSACPVAHKNVTSPKEQPAQQDAPAQAQEQCPMRSNGKEQQGGYKNPSVYNVYNQKIDPKNMMPTTANQQPAPGQRVALPVEREASSIPKGGTDETWLYPSPQMFWNALVRKNKTEGVIEEDMPDVIRIHNNMNERTWKQVLEWEKLRPSVGEGRDPRLLRFLGRPDELSIKAWLKTLFGHSPPFDRHDWYVDRGGKEVRYIIDYYHDEAGAASDKTPNHMKDFHSIRSILLDVRPALDSIDAIVDRVVRMPFFHFTGLSDFKPLPFFPKVDTISAEQRFAQQLRNTWMAIRDNCEKEKDCLLACKSEQECANASIALQHCTAKVICPQRAQEFADAIAAEKMDQNLVGEKYETLVKCIELFEIDSKKVLGSGRK